MSSFGPVALRWVLRAAMLPVAFIGFMFALMLEAGLTPSSTEALSACHLSGRMCWQESLGQAVAYALGAVLFVMLPVVLEPRDKFGVAVVFYGVGASIVALGVLVLSSLGFAQLWPMIFSPLIVGLGCVLQVGRVQGYGGAARLFSASPTAPSRSVRFWAVLRRVLLAPLVLLSVFVIAKLAAANEDRLFALCPPADYYPGDDSVPESCSDPRNERLQALNDYATTVVQIAFAVALAALLEPRFKRLAARLVWLVGSGFAAWLAALLAFTLWQHALLAFIVGAVCVWLVGRYTTDQ